MLYILKKTMNYLKINFCIHILVTREAYMEELKLLEEKWTKLIKERMSPPQNLMEETTSPPSKLDQNLTSNLILMEEVSLSSKSSETRWWNPHYSPFFMVALDDMLVAFFSMIVLHWNRDGASSLVEIEEREMERWDKWKRED